MQTRTAIVPHFRNNLGLENGTLRNGVGHRLVGRLSALMVAGAVLLGGVAITFTSVSKALTGSGFRGMLAVAFAHGGSVAFFTGPNTDASALISEI